MPAADRLSKLVDELYDAALEPALWPGALVSIGQFVGGAAVGVVSKDTVSKAGTPNHFSGFDPDYVRTYAETYAKLDPFATLPYFDIEQVVSSPELVPHDEFLRGRFYQEWAQPQGWIDAASCLLEKSATSFSLLGVVRHQSRGMVDDEMRRRMRFVVPHLRRAVLVGKTIDRRAAGAPLAAALDGLSAGVILTNATGRIVHANAAAHEMLAACNILRSGGGRLAAGRRRSEQALSAAIAAAGRGDCEIAGGLALPLVGRDETRYVAHVLPLISGRRRGIGLRSAAVAAVFVCKAKLGTPSPPEAIARAFGLTPTELRVLLAVVEVGGVPETAEVLGIGQATVKSHLHRLFGKTGTTRQADLVKLMAGFANPLVN